jgi:hypothetical protein
MDDMPPSWHDAAALAHPRYLEGGTPRRRSRLYWAGLFALHLLAAFATTVVAGTITGESNDDTLARWFFWSMIPFTQIWAVRFGRYRRAVRSALRP